MSNPDISSPTTPSIHLFLRLVAIFYDALLLIAVLFFAGVIVSPLLSMTGLMNVEKIGEHHLLVQLAFQLYLLAVSYFYFAWPWMRGGQTLGLQVWRVKLISSNDQPLTHRRLLIRFFISALSWACLGLGFFWSLFDPQRLTWHDKLSHTQLVKLPPKPPKSRS